MMNESWRISRTAGRKKKVSQTIQELLEDDDIEEQGGVERIWEGRDDKVRAKRRNGNTSS